MPKRTKQPGLDLNLSDFGKTLFRAVILLVATSVLPAYAQYEVAEIPFFNAPEGTAALGGGLRLGSDLYLAFDDSSDQRQFDLVPLYLYNGKYLFFRGTAGGVHLFRNDNFQLNLLGRYRFTKLDPDRNEFYAGLEERKQTVDAGAEVRFRGKWAIKSICCKAAFAATSRATSAEVVV